MIEESPPRHHHHHHHHHKKHKKKKHHRKPQQEPPSWAAEHARAIAAVAAVFVIAIVLGATLGTQLQKSSAPGSSGRNVTISINTQLQYDTSGNLVNFHAGSIAQYPVLNDGLFIGIGDVYDSCLQGAPICNYPCGYLGDLFAMYTTPDFSSWTLVSQNVYPGITELNQQYAFFSPNLGYSASRAALGLPPWVIIYAGNQFWNQNLVPFLVSDSPYGPFEFGWTARITASTMTSSTMLLFVDPSDGAGFIRYNTADSPHRHVVEKLSDDWTSFTGEYSVIYTKPNYPWGEQGSAFVRQGIYYQTIGTDCCYCEARSHYTIAHATESRQVAFLTSFSLSLS